MSHPFGRLFLGLAFCFTTLFAVAQEVSPYSRYGLGDLQSTDFSAVKAMGGLSSVYRNPLQPNYSNPASYSALSLTTMEVGLSYGTKSLNLRDTTFNAGDAFLDYLAISLPIGKRVGVSAGLVPFSKMNYNFNQNALDSTIGSYNRTYTGSGRTYEAYIGGGYRIFGSDTARTRHQLSVGLNFNVLFGSLRYSEALNFPDSSTALSTRRNVTNRVTDFIFDLGFQYKVRLNRLDTVVLKNNLRKTNTFLTLGGYAKIPVNRASTVDETYDRLLTTSGTTTIIDTLSFSSTGKRTLNTPPKIGFGLSINKGYFWMLGVDFSYTMWKSFKDINEPTLTFRNDMRLAVGGEIRPKSESRNFLARTFYRLGGYYDNGYLTLSGQDIKEYGVTFGFGFPMTSEGRAYGLTAPYINFSFDVGSRGTKSADLIQERYFKGTISLTLNGKWFVKPQYE